MSRADRFTERDLEPDEVRFPDEDDRDDDGDDDPEPGGSGPDNDNGTALDL